MIATEFTNPDGAPGTDLAKAVTKGCLERRLLLLTCGPWGDTIRWIPPLMVQAEQIAWALEVFEQVLAECVR
jgi:4-aminobutyrate aminotransferase